MGITSLYGTQTYRYLSECVPCKEVITEYRLFPKYDLHTVKSSRALLGSMCDCGIRSCYSRRYFVPQFSAPMTPATRKSIQELMLKNKLNAYDAYLLCNKMNQWTQEGISDDIVTDYENLVCRAMHLYGKSFLSVPEFGKYFNVSGIVGAFECDCIDTRSVYEMKITDRVEDKYWIQVLSYSMLSMLVDNIPRCRIGLIMPTLGKAYYFIYEKHWYYAIFNAFKKIYGREIL